MFDWVRRFQIARGVQDVRLRNMDMARTASDTLQTYVLNNLEGAILQNDPVAVQQYRRSLDEMDVYLRRAHAIEQSARRHVYFDARGV